MTKPEDAKVIGERLREIRGIRPRTKVADQLGVSRSSMAKYEAGLRIPRGKVKEQIAKYYGVSVEEIFYVHQ